MHELQHLFVVNGTTNGVELMMKSLMDDCQGLTVPIFVQEYIQRLEGDEVSCSSSVQRGGNCVKSGCFKKAWLGTAEMSLLVQSITRVDRQDGESCKLRLIQGTLMSRPHLLRGAVDKKLRQDIKITGFDCGQIVALLYDCEMNVGCLYAKFDKDDGGFDCFDVDLSYALTDDENVDMEVLRKQMVPEEILKSNELLRLLSVDSDLCCVLAL